MQKTSEILIWIRSCLSKYLFYEGNESELNLNPKKIALYNRKLKKNEEDEKKLWMWLTLDASDAEIFLWNKQKTKLN